MVTQNTSMTKSELVRRLNKAEARVTLLEQHQNKVDAQHKEFTDKLIAQNAELESQVSGLQNSWSEQQDQMIEYVERIQFLEQEDHHSQHQISDLEDAITSLEHAVADKTAAELAYQQTIRHLLNALLS